MRLGLGPGNTRNHTRKEDPKQNYETFHQKETYRKPPLFRAQNFPHARRLRRHFILEDPENFPDDPQPLQPSLELPSTPPNSHEQKTLVAEFVGTFALVFVGVSAMHHLDGTPGALIGIALAHGLTIAVMASAVMAISGSQFNPAVTIALLCSGHIDLRKAVAFIVTQCLAGFVAALSLKAFLPHEAIAAGTPALAEGVSVGQALLVEAVLTFFLVFVIYGVAIDKRDPHLGAIFIGFAITMGIFVGGPITSAAMNPARHLGTAIIGRDPSQFAQIPLYWAGPILGGIAAVLVYKHILSKAAGD